MGVLDVEDLEWVVHALLLRPTRLRAIRMRSMTAPVVPVMVVIPDGSARNHDKARPASLPQADCRAWVPCGTGRATRVVSVLPPPPAAFPRDPNSSIWGGGNDQHHFWGGKYQHLFQGPDSDRPGCIHNAFL